MILKELKKKLASEIKGDIFDIVIFGSVVNGKTAPKDIDILVIFENLSLKDRLDILQHMKKKIPKGSDIQQILLKDLFEGSFFAKTGILLEGISCRTVKEFSEQLGFSGYSIFTYDFKGLSHTQKIRFNYVLSGRRKNTGILEEIKGIRLGDGVIKVPIFASDEFEEIFLAHHINYKRFNILEERTD